MPIKLEQVENIKTLFGNRIRQLRKARSITQEDLAYILKTDTRQIGRIENGEAFVNLKTVTKLANALDVPVKELFDFDE
ncbi:helix-turn-helix transcriptional regulator [Fulvivirgaceae bacterium BMA12]|uniref:Helix-turn-helix transcriptional regulator n=1 Tax=Agaribacillus aureus TaxID=3051825 RepID=A0ABT8LFC1_9BACT|nr:helix-turn-helix transcriptional regulator [Fulvivirgaceae bacterium BMA12]